MHPQSPWLLNINMALNAPRLKPFFQASANGYGFAVLDLQDGCWLVTTWPDRGSGRREAIKR